VTTEFDSFDESPLGAFIESPLGARGIAGLRLVIAMTWTDESKEKETSYQESPQIYFDHLNEWRRFVADTETNERIEIRATVVIPLGSLRGRWWDLIPRGEPWPSDAFQFAETGRPGSLLEFITAFNTIRDGDIPNTLVLLVDNSGSMSIADILPTYQNFQDWIRENFSDVSVHRATFFDEQWIQRTQEAIRDAINLPP